MSREQVLEDVLCDRAADVSVDPAALTAILNTPNPNSPSDKQRRSDQQTQPTPTTPMANAVEPKSISTGASAAATGGSFFGKLAGLFAAIVVVGAIAVGGGAVFLNSNPQCPALDSALQTVNNEVLANVGENPNIALSCDGEVTSLMDIRSNLSPENHARFDENFDDIEAAHSCLTEAATPLGITSLVDALTSECAGN